MPPATSPGDTDKLGGQVIGMLDHHDWTNLLDALRPGHISNFARTS